MRSGYELDVYFKSKRFCDRLDFFRELGEGYDFAGALFIVNRFELMQYHYGIIRHYILTGEYDPSKENRHQIEIIDYTNRRVAGLSSKGEKMLEEIGLNEPLEGVHLLIPPGTRKKDLKDFINDPENSKLLKQVLSEAYKDEPSQKRAFRPVTRIEDYLEIVEKIDKEDDPDYDFILSLALDYKVDDRDITRMHKRLGRQNNPFLNPVK